MTLEIQRLVSEVIEEDVTLMQSPLEMRNARMFAVKVRYVVAPGYKNLTKSIRSLASAVCSMWLDRPTRRSPTTFTDT